MTKRFLGVYLLMILLICAAMSISAQTDELPVSLDLSEMDTQDFAGTKFYQLKRGHLVLVVSTDPKNPVADWLRRHTGEKITLTLSGKDER